MGNLILDPGIYEHHLGGRYTVLFQVHDSTNATEGRAMVVYVSHTTGRPNCRDQDEFMEFVEWPDGVKRPRFQLVKTLAE